MSSRAVIGLVLVGLSGVVGVNAHAQTPAATARTHVVLLGTGTPNADPDRSGNSVAVVVDSTAYIVDAGSGVVRRAAAAVRDRGIRALQAARLRTVFITHLHSDHTVGLADLMFSPWVLGRTVPLDVYGPAGTAAMVRHLNEAYEADVQMRLYGGEPSNKTGYGGRGFDVSAGEVYRDSLVRVTAFEVLHGSWPHAFGYRFDTPDRSIVISGDTRPSDAVVRACNGCDVLVHEVISSHDIENRTPDWKAYHLAFHTPSIELGDVATKAHPKLLVLYHQIPGNWPDEKFVAEVKTRYSGRVVSGRDLDVF
ncbi:MAG TPA: MBL fold metallo-hydrolase [Gemmatimonadaceae bacterium]|nr:MBL fold metallo-hydrolase [Gemmatimonadaceae bacterium]